MTKKRKKHTPEQIVAKLRDAVVMLNTGKDMAAVLQSLEMSEATYERWRNIWSLTFVFFKKITASDCCPTVGLASGRAAGCRSRRWRGTRTGTATVRAGRVGGGVRGRRPRGSWSGQLSFDNYRWRATT